MILIVWPFITKVLNHILLMYVTNHAVFYASSTMMMKLFTQIQILVLYIYHVYRTLNMYVCYMMHRLFLITHP